MCNTQEIIPHIPRYLHIFNYINKCLPPDVPKEIDKQVPMSLMGKHDDWSFISYSVSFRIKFFGDFFVVSVLTNNQ